LPRPSSWPFPRSQPPARSSSTSRRPWRRPKRRRPCERVITWAPGYWTWTGPKYEWTKGHYVQARKGYRYVAPRWAQEKERWALYPEEWVKDEDDKDKTA
jgi:hypothetical protein